MGKTVSVFLYSIVKSIHVSIILYIVLTPFISMFSKLPIDTAYLDSHLLFSILLATRWHMNQYECILTKMEHWLSGRKFEDGIIYQVVNPVFKIDKKELKQNLMHGIILLILLNLGSRIKYRAIYESFRSNKKK